MKSKFVEPTFLEMAFNFIKNKKTKELQDFLKQHKDKIKDLINNVVDEETGRNCLHEAVMQKDFKILQILLREFSDEIDVSTPLHDHAGESTALHLSIFSWSDSFKYRIRY